MDDRLGLAESCGKQMLSYCDMHHHAMEGKAAITLSQYLE